MISQKGSASEVELNITHINEENPRTEYVKLDMQIVQLDQFAHHEEGFGEDDELDEPEACLVEPKYDEVDVINQIKDFHSDIEIEGFRIECFRRDGVDHYVSGIDFHWKNQQTSQILSFDVYNVFRKFILDLFSHYNMPYFEMDDGAHHYGMDGNTYGIVQMVTQEIEPPSLDEMWEKEMMEFGATGFPRPEKYEDMYEYNKFMAKVNQYRLEKKKNDKD